MKMKKPLKKILLLHLPVMIIVLSGCKESTDSEIDMLKSFELKRLESLVNADIELADTLHAEDFELITPKGNVYDRGRYLGTIESGTLDYRTWNADSDSIRVRLYQDAAVIRYTDLEFEVYVNGQPSRSGLLKHTNFYEKRDGQWRIVWSQASGGEDLD